MVLSNFIDALHVFRDSIPKGIDPDIYISSSKTYGLCFTAQYEFDGVHYTFQIKPTDTGMVQVSTSEVERIDKR